MDVTRDEILTICREEIIPLWKKQSQDFPDFLGKSQSHFPCITKEEKKQNESVLEELLQGFQAAFSKKPVGRQEEQEWTKDANQLLSDFLQKEQILFIRKYMEQETFFQFERETKSFIRQARDFDQTLTIAQIWQALRNYLIYSMIVEMQGEEQKVKAPIFSYSLLYPYTDNFIDDASNGQQEKEHYNKLIADKIMGKEAVPENELEKKTCKLLEKLLAYYDMPEKQQQKSMVQKSLLLLLEAQNNSIGQQGKRNFSETRRENTPHKKVEKKEKQTGKIPEAVDESTDLLTSDEILQISVYKGSTSVLADYLFSTKDWKEDEMDFYLKFGFLLQLVDDLQDMKEDLLEGSKTLMNEAWKNGKLEQQVNRLLWFTHRVIEGFEPRMNRLKPFVLRHCVGVSLMAVGMNQDVFSKEYINQIEPYLPVSLSYLKKLRKKLTKTGDKRVDAKEIDASRENSGIVADRMRLLDLFIAES